MAQIHPDLLSKIKRKLGISTGHAYRLIDAAVRDTNLPRNVAAIVLARNAGLNISRFASDDDWILIRAAAGNRPTTTTSDALPMPAAPVGSVRRTKARAMGKKKTNGNKGWVVDGRHERLRK